MKKRKTQKLKKGAWFVKTRGSYLPVRLEGWLMHLVLLVVGVLMLIALAMDARDGADVVPTLTEFTLGLVFLGAVYTWLAKQKS